MIAITLTAASSLPPAAPGYVECMCNGHATDCQYDAELESAACVSCIDDTMGNNCDQCLPQFYRNMAVQRSDPDTCIGRYNCHSA